MMIIKKNKFEWEVLKKYEGQAVSPAPQIIMELSEEIMNNFDKILKLYQNKVMSRDEIIDKYGINKNYLYKKIKKAGLQLWDKHDREVDRDTVIKIYKSKKMNRKQIAEKFKVKKKTIYKILRDNDIELWDKKSNKTKKATQNRYFGWNDYKNNIMSNYNK